jgi:SAM-dependent methyltransferase
MAHDEQRDPAEQAQLLAADSLAAGDPTGWFQRLYLAAEDGAADVPWDRGGPHPLLVEWTEARELDGRGERALVVGCGLGGDAEHVAALGFDTVAFDVAAAAVRAARRRYPGSNVRYVTADLLDPPADWRGAFDLVVESMTVQSLPDPPRREAIARVGQMVAPGGTLIAIAVARDEADPVDGPPWPLTRAEVDAFATGGLQSVRIEDVVGAVQPAVRRWRAEFRRPGLA